MYELDTGYHLCTVRMKVPLTTVTMDMCEYFLFLGSTEGDIYRINLFDMVSETSLFYSFFSFFFPLFLYNFKQSG